MIFAFIFLLLSFECNVYGLSSNVTNFATQKNVTDIIPVNVNEILQTNFTNVRSVTVSTPVLKNTSNILLTNITNVSPVQELVTPFEKVTKISSGNITEKSLIGVTKILPINNTNDLLINVTSVSLVNATILSTTKSNVPIVNETSVLQKNVTKVLSKTDCKVPLVDKAHKSQDDQMIVLPMIKNDIPIKATLDSINEHRESQSLFEDLFDSIYEHRELQSLFNDLFDFLKFTTNSQLLLDVISDFDSLQANSKKIIKLDICCFFIKRFPYSNYPNNFKDKSCQVNYNTKKNIKLNKLLRKLLKNAFESDVSIYTSAHYISNEENCPLFYWRETIDENSMIDLVDILFFPKNFKTEEMKNSEYPIVIRQKRPLKKLLSTILYLNDHIRLLED